MSKYSDLRWKIADLEKELETEKNVNKRLTDDLQRYILTIYEKDNEIKKLGEIIKLLNKDKKMGEDNAKEKE